MRYPLPQFVFSDYPNFIKFLDVYYDTLDNSDGKHNYSYVVNELLHNLSSDGDLHNRLNSINEYISKIPSVDVKNKKLFIRNIVDFMQTKGTEKSFKILFNTIYESPSSVYYPREEVLVASGSKINIKNYINIARLVLDDMSGVIITGEDTGATATVNSKVILFDKGYTELEVINIVGTFSVEERIIWHDSTGYRHIDNVVRIIDKFTVKKGGSYYKIGDPVSNSSGLIGVVSNIGSGPVTGYTIIEGGSGYAIGDKLIVDAEGLSGGYGASGHVITVSNTGKITGIEITHGGNGYQYLPRITVDSVGGSGAEIILTGDKIGSVTEVDVINPYATNSIKDIKLPEYVTTADGTRYLSSRVVGDYFDKRPDFDGPTYQAIDYGLTRYGRTMLFKDMKASLSDAWGYSGSGGSGVTSDVGIIDGELGAVIYDVRYGYETTTSHLSGSSKIQDNNYYQSFSYIVSSNVEFDKYEHYIKDLLHPIGNKVFYNYVRDNDINNIKFKTIAPKKNKSITQDA